MDTTNLEGLTNETDTVISEGKATIYQPAKVFYNPVQEFNRDLTINVIKCFYNRHKEKKPNAKGFTIVEGLAASGLRSIRFAKEIDGITQITANDFDRQAVEYINKNIAFNNVSDIVQSSCQDAAVLLYSCKYKEKQFDVVDLDPYGSAAMFIDAGVQAVKDGGLLCVTCTDLATLCGNAPESCQAKYSSMSLKAKFCHEMALRILLHTIEIAANRYGRYIEPLVSMSVDFYVRIFVIIRSGQHAVKDSVTKLGRVYHCRTCGAFQVQPIAIKTPTSNYQFKYSPAYLSVSSDRCLHCNSHWHLGGPVWINPIHSPDFTVELLTMLKSCDESNFKTLNRMIGMLTVMKEELDLPFYYVLDDLCSVLHLTVPPMKVFRSAILNAGFRVSYSHAAKGSVKTDMPMVQIWDILRCWNMQHPVKETHLKPNTPVVRILSVEVTHQADFSVHPEAVPQSQLQGLLRWQANPEKNWGPKPRAKKGANLTLDELCLKGIAKAHERKEKRKKKIDFKHIPCKRLKDGLCTRGGDCRYNHDMDSSAGACDTELCGQKQSCDQTQGEQS